MSINKHYLTNCMDGIVELSQLADKNPKEFENAEDVLGQISAIIFKHSMLSSVYKLGEQSLKEK